MNRELYSGSPAWFGLTDERAQRRLGGLGWWGERGPASDYADVLSALSRSPDPDAALVGLERMREADTQRWPAVDAALVADRGLRARLLAVLGSSTALTDVLVTPGDVWQRLGSDAETAETAYDAALVTVVSEGGEIVAEETATQRLRAAYRAILTEIAAADLGHVVDSALEQAPYAATAGRLTTLAEAALRAGLAIATASVERSDECSLAVIAMGKCGGRELNYVSDVDVVFAGDGDMDVANKLARTMMRIVGKSCFEVDAALRPEGNAGPLVRTCAGHEAYYRRWARTWEFQALLKARHVAGDAELGRRYVELVMPFVWSASERENFVPDVQRMRTRVEDNVPPEVGERELKLGRGGLRDVEFAVQLLQLVHGRVDADVRARSTVEALAELGDGGYIGRADAAELTESYVFLRMLEHRLQLRRLRRTHLFPARSDVDELRWLARAAGVRADSRSPVDTLVRMFQQHATRIRRLHEKLFYRPLLEAVARVPADALRLTTAQAVSRLAALGYAAADGALEHIKALTTGVSRRAAIQQTLLPVMLDLLADTPDPDGGLLAYRRVSEALSNTPWYLRLVRDEATVVERMAVVLGTSKFVPDLLVRAPEVLRSLADSDELANRSLDEVATSLRTAVARQRTPESAVATARSLRRHELVRVACADILGLLDVSAACAALSGVWVAVLRAALQAAIREQGGDDDARARIAVIGMGRLGGAELGYGSDADVLFVCEPCGEVADADAVGYATRVATMVRDMLGAPSQDPPLQVDVDLRPEGRSGPMVRTLDSYRAYYGRWGEVWEAQALLRARPVAGDSDLGERFLAAIDGVRYPEGGLDDTGTRKVRRLKARVDTERMPRGADPTTHTKLGRGGLADVEWTVQLHQLQHAHWVPALRTPATLDALDALVEAALVDAGDADALRAAWLLATRARNATMLVRGKPADQLPGSGRDLAAVARLLGYSAADDPGEFLDDYRRTTRQAHAVAERLFYGE